MTDHEATAQSLVHRIQVGQLGFFDGRDEVARALRAAEAMGQRDQDAEPQLSTVVVGVNDRATLLQRVAELEASEVPRFQVAMRLALDDALDGVEVSDEIANAIEDAIFNLPEPLAYVDANPCACSLGACCPYRGLPPGDADTGHCQQCGVFMPDAPDASVGDEVLCSGCGTSYSLGEPEEC